MELSEQIELEYAEPQRQVQRWLGRCMLSLQRSERLLKALLHDADVTVVHSGREGEGAAAFEVSRKFEKERLATMTLGGLVTAFLGGVVSDGESLSGNQKEPDLPDDRFAFKAGFQWPLPRQAFDDLQSSMREMVLMRNEWVHHLVERFDLWSLDGCRQALDSLQAGYEKAERFRLQLHGVAQCMAEASQHMVTFSASPQGKAVLFGSKIPLESTPLLNALRDAVHHAASAGDVDGTVPLSEVLQKLQSTHPDVKPQDYGYASWPQVIHESHLYRIVRRDADGHKIAPLVCLLGLAAPGNRPHILHP